MCWVSKWEIPSCKIKIEIAVINLSANEQVSRLSDAISQTWICVKMLSSGSLWCFSRLCNHSLVLINTSAIMLSNIDGFVSCYCSCTDLAAERWYRPGKNFPTLTMLHLPCYTYDVTLSTYHVTARKSGATWRKSIKWKFELVWKLQEILIGGDEVVMSIRGNVPTLVM